MQLLKTKSAGVWARRMRCLLLPCEEAGVCGGGEGMVGKVRSRGLRARGKATMPGRTWAADDDATHASERGGGAAGHPPMLRPRVDLASYQHSAPHALAYYGMNNQGSDLRRFLEEVGTDPREARYWLKQFRISSDSLRPFAVVQVEKDVFNQPDMLDSLGSCIAFLYRCEMRVVLVHGNRLPADTKITPALLKSTRKQLAADSMLLVSILESHGAPARPLFTGSTILSAEHTAGGSLRGSVTEVNTDPIQWALRTGHIPVLPSLGESAIGQLLTLDLDDVTSSLAQTLQPLKVMILNTAGGITDRQGEVIPTVHLPADMETIQSAYHPGGMKGRLSRICSLLNLLPSQSSVVITSASTIITELFTHHGSGTLLKNTEPIQVHRSLDDVDCDRLLALINRSFGKDLNPGYFDELCSKLETLYLSEGYNAAAIVTREEGIDVPYLDKFAVSMTKQGEGTGEMLWDYIRRDCKQLFWRSRKSNKINPWYFKRSEGSWNNGNWTVFWYGITKHQQSSQVVDHALNLQNAFSENGSGLDLTLVD